VSLEVVSGGRDILVDPEDRWLLDNYNWSLHGKGYVVTYSPAPTDGVTRLHHCIVGMPIDPDVVIDHIDRNKLNNKRNNLRYTTRTENYLNSDRSDNATYIYKQTWSGRYYVDITRQRQRYYGGTYDTYDEAITARDTLLRSIC